MESIQSNYVRQYNESQNNDVNSTSLIIVDTKPCKRQMYNYFYSVFHVILSIAALYLSFKCTRNKGTGVMLLHFVIALFCPLIYILFIVATTNNMCSN